MCSEQRPLHESSDCLLEVKNIGKNKTIRPKSDGGFYDSTMSCWINKLQSNPVTCPSCKQAERTQEALLLLCKVHFVMEDFHSCVKYCNQAGADDIYIDSQSKRKSKLVADGFAYKGN